MSPLATRGHRSGSSVWQAIYQEAMRRGMDSAGETVVIGDGAHPGIWKYCPMNSFMRHPDC